MPDQTRNTRSKDEQIEYLLDRLSKAQEDYVEAVRDCMDVARENNQLKLQVAELKDVVRVPVTAFDQHERDDPITVESPEEWIVRARVALNK